MSDEPPLQWIFHFECFHFLAHVYIKEFCGYCIQTGQTILYYVQTPAHVLGWMDPIHVSTFAIQSKRHGFSLHDGDISITDLHKKLIAKVSKECTIFTTSRLVERYFTRNAKTAYPDVINLED